MTARRWVLDMEMPPAFLKRTPPWHPPAPPLYRYFDQSRGSASTPPWFRCGCQRAHNVFFSTRVKISVESIETPSIFASWGARWFGSDFGDPPRKQRFWGPNANPSGDVGSATSLKGRHGTRPVARCSRGPPHPPPADHRRRTISSTLFSLHPDLPSGAGRVQMRHRS